MITLGEGNGNALQYSCLENPSDGGAWWASVYEVTQSQTQLKRLSSSSSMITLYLTKLHWVGKISFRRKWQLTPVVLPGKFHGQRGLMGYSPWVAKESDKT